MITAKTQYVSSLTRSGTQLLIGVLRAGFGLIESPAQAIFAALHGRCWRIARGLPSKSFPEQASSRAILPGSAGTHIVSGSISNQWRLTLGTAQRVTLMT